MPSFTSASTLVSAPNGNKTSTNQDDSVMIKLGSNDDNDIPPGQEAEQTFGGGELSRGIDGYRHEKVFIGQRFSERAIIKAYTDVRNTSWKMACIPAIVKEFSDLANEGNDMYSSSNIEQSVLEPLFNQHNKVASIFDLWRTGTMEDSEHTTTETVIPSSLGRWNNESEMEGIQEYAVLPPHSRRQVAKSFAGSSFEDEVSKKELLDDWSPGSSGPAMPESLRSSPIIPPLEGDELNIRHDTPVSSHGDEVSHFEDFEDSQAVDHLPKALPTSFVTSGDQIMEDDGSRLPPYMSPNNYNDVCRTEEHEEIRKMAPLPQSVQTPVDEPTFKYTGTSIQPMPVSTSLGEDPSRMEEQEDIRLIDDLPPSEKTEFDIPRLDTNQHSLERMAFSIAHNEDNSSDEMYEDNSFIRESLGPTDEGEMDYCFEKQEDLQVVDSSWQLHSATTTPQIARSPPSQKDLHDLPNFKSIRRPKYPICMSTTKPPKFSIEAQKGIMRWKHYYKNDCRPYWIIDPDLQLIKDTIKPAMSLLELNTDDLSVSWLAEGGWHKVYTVTTSCTITGERKTFVLRLALPVYPYYKVESDVATTELVRHFTTIPVPLIYCYDSSSDNPLGLEWMLMEKVEASALRKVWFDLDNKLHIAITRQLAGWADELSRIQSNLVGSIYMRCTDTELQFFIGPPTMIEFYRRRRLLYSVNRGPFDSFSDYYDAVLDLHIQELQDEATHHIELDTASEKEVTDTWRSTCDQKVFTREQADTLDLLDLAGFGGFHEDMIETVLPICKALREALPQIQLPLLSTMLMHDDISLENVLTDDNGTVKTLLDWEAAVLRPTHAVRNFISLLNSEDRDSYYNWTSYNPRRKYLMGGGEDDYTDPNGSIWNSSMEEIEEIIQTRLRPYYKAELGGLQSPLLATFAFAGESDLEQLDYRVFDPVDYQDDMQEWLNKQLGIDGRDSEYENSEDGYEEGLDASIREENQASNPSVEAEVESNEV
ncbi:hypothetical protein MMC27_000693 [Xylographa pallens]|nr:hypothetical protein [Xylographa pallens]